ncbi:hypothetical protein SISNIDRAFT_408834 [Sistotremastrum niveocremeum HHB9708]|uniref:DUF6589 domain-containing protein n=1 Tax=Sistotremastrum niveocremeum HHB9708 TaxID=1314777 RepID=A0A164WH03_9AGAM|nr:hypothetical protein SISNIDRAFT_408834 [Sistotremastrum niveocremeum HHB9708]
MVQYICHADLGTVEKVESAQSSRSVQDDPEDTDADREQHVLMVMGVFHLLMALCDALWRVYILGASRTAFDGALFEIIGILRSKEQAKFLSPGGPGFRRMHDIIMQDSIARFSHAILVELRRKYPATPTFAEWMTTKPSWADVVSLADDVLKKYLPGQKFSSQRAKFPLSERDPVFENNQLWFRDILTYIEHYKAGKAGDIGRLLDTLVPASFIFKAAGKHKYAVHTLRHYAFLKHGCPPDVARVVMQSWLVNPTGKPDGYRGVDWLVERNNLATKSIYSGKSSNHTVATLIKRSPLIEILRQCHLLIDRNFALAHKNDKHKRPSISKNNERLHKKYEEDRVFEYIIGREAYSIVNVWEKGADGCKKDYVNKVLDVEELGDAGDAGGTRNVRSIDLNV